MSRLRRFAELIPAVAIVAAAGMVFPAGVDAFELPKRLVWGALAVALSALALFDSFLKVRRKASAAIVTTSDVRRSVMPRYVPWGTALLSWMILRTVFSCGETSRWGLPLLAWATPLLLFLLSSSQKPGGPSSGFIARCPVAWTVVCLGLGEAAIMVLQYFGLDPLFGSATRAIAYAPGRMIGTIGYQNQAAEFVGVALCAVLAVRKGRDSRNDSRFSPRNAFLILSSSVMALAVFLSANRGAVIGLVATFFVCVCIRTRRGPRATPRAFRRTATMAASVMIVSVAAFGVSSETRNRVGDLFNPIQSVAVQSRLWMAKSAVSLLRDHPFFGGGAGRYAYEYVDRLGSLVPGRKEHDLLRNLVWAREAHCDSLQFLAEFGGVGAVLLFAFAWTLWRARDRVPRSEWDAIVPGAVFLGVCSLFSFSLQTAFAAPVAGLLFGELFRAAQFRQRELTEEDREKAEPAKSPCVGGSPGRLAPPVCRCVLSSFALGAFAVGISANVMNLNWEESYWDLLSGDDAPLCGGQWLARVANRALEDGRHDFAIVCYERAQRGFVSPEVLLASASAFLSCGRIEDAITALRRVEKSGLQYGRTLKLLSLALEKSGQIAESAEIEAKRFRLWGGVFSDVEVYRLAALSLMSGNAGLAGELARRFEMRCRLDGRLDSWTPEWDNLLGGAFLAAGRREEALKYFAEALRRKPSLISARRNLMNATRQ